MHDRYSDPFDPRQPTRWQRWWPRPLAIGASIGLAFGCEGPALLDCIHRLLR